ncbi:hypothetical protein H4R20_002346 [Coemansia guatemalensis]|uniref:Uncharacterized protein n=1 Tax=Coemansia guatemalensis TaxID=2761395 RepID=A0A9W8LV43_9FUNG|nr:hypothetical protein H4R20_002346 [Coemansia guatemalensis]
MDKRGKKFTTANSMLDILDRVSQAEESRVDKKIQRQEDIKNQLRQGYSLKGPGKPTKKPAKKLKKAKKTLARTLSSVNREWSAAFDDDDENSSNSLADAKDAGAANPKSDKKVSFAV